MQAIAQDRIDRVARIYNNNLDASRALGIAMRSFSRLCRRYDIETPYSRKRRRMQEAAGCMKEARRIDAVGGFRADFGPK